MSKIGYNESRALQETSHIDHLQLLKNREVFRYHDTDAQARPPVAAMLLSGSISCWCKFSNARTAFVEINETPDSNDGSSAAAPARSGGASPGSRTCLGATRGRARTEGSDNHRAADGAAPPAPPGRWGRASSRASFEAPTPHRRRRREPFVSSLRVKAGQKAGTGTRNARYGLHQRMGKNGDVGRALSAPMMRVKV